VNPEAIAFDRHGELRSGWRMFLFIGLLIVLLLMVSVPLVLLEVATEFSVKALGVVVIGVASYVMTRFINHKPFIAIGLSLHPAAVRGFGIGCLLGFLMVAGVFAVEYLAGYIDLRWGGLSASSATWVFFSGCVYFLVGAAFEELIFRGYLFQTLMQAVTFLPAMLVMAALFAIAHGRNPNVTAYGLINVALATVWLSFAYLKSRSLWLPIGLHFSWNFSQTTLFSFPTSGISFDGRSLASLVQSGPVWLTGGAFGPEGGALATLALIICTWYILKSKALAVPEGIVTLDSSEDLLMAGGSGTDRGSQ
jgi:membrane protease YdiL (CAAX protease family)